MTERPAKKAPAAKKVAARRGAPLRDIEDIDLPGDPPITEQQMRQLHALLRTRVGFTDRADILDWCSTAVGRDIESRKDLTHPEALHLIELLGHLPMAPATEDQWTALRAEFPPSEVGRLPRSTCRDCSNAPRKVCERHKWVTRCHLCNNSHSDATMHIDYVGHADVTARLLAVDPTWTYEVMTVGPDGPMLDRNDGLWINLTILGVTRPGYGACDPGSHQKGGDRVKVAIGDALRNAAMRFGVALDLWAKGDREWARAEKNVPEPAPDEPATTEPTPEKEWRGAPRGRLLLDIDDLADRIGMTREQITTKWRAENGGMSMEDFNTRVPPHVLDQLVRSFEAYVATMTTPARP